MSFLNIVPVFFYPLQPAHIDCDLRLDKPDLGTDEWNWKNLLLIHMRD